MSIGFGVPSTGKLSDALAEIPEDVRGYFRLGFARICSVDQSRWPMIVSAISKISSPHTADLELERVVSELKVDGDEIHHLVNSSRLLLGILAFRIESCEEVVASIVEAGILVKENEDAILAFAKIASADRGALKQALSMATLQHSLLPSLMQLEVKVDLRLEFDGDSITRTAPVVLVHLDTDAVDQEIWFQLTPSQVEGFISRLQQALRQVGVAETLLKSQAN